MEKRRKIKPVKRTKARKSCIQAKTPIPRYGVPSQRRLPRKISVCPLALAGRTGTTGLQR